MAYFSNGCEGEVFDRQCMRCKYGDRPCPIALVQMTHNYEAANNKTAREILDTLVSDKGVCAMFKMDPESFGSLNNCQTCGTTLRDWRGSGLECMRCMIDEVNK